MSTAITDNFQLNAALSLDNKYLKNGATPYASIAEVNSTITGANRNVGLTVLIDDTEYWYRESTEDVNLVIKAPCNPVYTTVASLVAATDYYSDYTVVRTLGFYSVNDGGGSFYYISPSSLPGFASDAITQILLLTGQYAILSHTGTLKLSQFGAKGDGVRNDLDSFRTALKFSKYDKTLTTIYGRQGANYYMTLLSTTFPFDGDFANSCYLYFDHSAGNVTWDGRGARIIVDNNASQCHVTYTVDGHFNLYRCKMSHTYGNMGTVNEPIQVPTDTLGWQNYFWEIVETDTDPAGPYNPWVQGHQYCGAHDFHHVGINVYDLNPDPTVITKNIEWINWEMLTTETDAFCSDELRWNIAAKFTFNADAISNINYKNCIFHHWISEVIFGGATGYVKDVNVQYCSFDLTHNGVSHGGKMDVSNNVFTRQAANAVESFSPTGDKQTYRNNIIHDCNGNGITVGGQDILEEVFAHIFIENNDIYNNKKYGVFVAGQIRNAKILGNTFYDNDFPAVSLYALSVSTANVNSEIIVANNNFLVYKKSGLNFITLNSAHGVAKVTGNILIGNNFFGTSELSYTSGPLPLPASPFNATWNVGIQFTGEKWGIVNITGNTIGKGLNSPNFVDYVNNSTGWTPDFRGNSYLSSIPFQSINVEVQPSASAAIRPYWGHIRNDRPTLAITDWSWFGCMFISAPSFAAFPFYPCFEGFDFIGENRKPIVIIPSGNDDLNRAVICYSADQQYYVASLIQDKGTSDAGNINRRRWKWEFKKTPLTVPLTVLMTFTLSGTVPAAGNIQITGTGPLPFFPFAYEAFAIDKRAASNAANGVFPGLTMNPYMSDTTEMLSVANTTAADIDISGTAYFRVYPFGNVSFLPNNIQPLRYEGTTALRPVGEDISNYFAFYDAQTDEQLLWDKLDNQWIAK